MTHSTEIEDFISKAKRARKSADISDNWQILFSLLTANGYEPRTLKRVVSDIRAEIKTLDTSKPINRKRIEWVCGYTKESGERVPGIVTVGQEIAEQVKNQDGENLYNKLENKAQYIITGFEQMRERAIAILKGSCFYSELAVALGLVTGRRSIELLKTGRFEVVDKQHVKFYGQAKKKEASKPYTIPVLCDAELVVKALERIRKFKGAEFESLSNDEVNQRCANTLNKAVRAEFQGYISGGVISMHDTRRIYTRYCVDTLFDKETGSRDRFIKAPIERTFISELLGHEYDKLGKGTEVGIAYEYFTIKP